MSHFNDRWNERADAELTADQALTEILTAYEQKTDALEYVMPARNLSKLYRFFPSKGPIAYVIMRADRVLTVTDKAMVRKLKWCKRKSKKGKFGIKSTLHGPNSRPTI